MTTSAHYVNTQPAGPEAQAHAAKWCLDVCGICFRRSCSMSSLPTAELRPSTPPFTAATTTTTIATTTTTATTTRTTTIEQEPVSLFHDSSG